MRGVIFVPQQLQRHMFVALQFRVDRGAVRNDVVVCAGRAALAQDPPLQLRLVEALRLLPLPQAARTARRYFETAPCDSDSARAISRAVIWFERAG